MTSSPGAPAAHWQAEHRHPQWEENLESCWVGVFGQLPEVVGLWCQEGAGATRTRMRWRGNMWNELGQVSVGVLSLPLPVKLRPCVVQETAEDARV